MDITFNLPPALILGLIVSTILPLLVGLVTRTVTHGGPRQSSSPRSRPSPGF